MIGTLGVVRGSSKKQRVAKKNIKATRKIEKNTEEANRIAQQQLEQDQANMANVQSQVEAQTTDQYQELERLADLKEKGIITHEEFEAKKKQILGLD